MKTKQISFKGFYAQETNKSQIYLHHTAGGPSADQVYQWWESNPVRVATCVVIDASGEIVQGFKSEYWAYHLGLTNDVFKKNGCTFIPLDKSSIGIEICCWREVL